MSVQSLTVLEKNDAASTFMRTTSCAPFGRDLSRFGAEIYIYRPSHSHKNCPHRTPSALIQAAFPKAASTNAMLADVLFPSRLAGASRSGACYWQFPDLRMTNTTTRRVISRKGKGCACTSSGKDVL